MLERIDALVADRVLVFGSLPPEARDLDLLLRPAEERVVADALEQLGFVRSGEQWALFHDQTVDVVELVPAADWGLPAAECAALFERGRAIGRRHVVRPAPDHALLILARRMARAGGPLSEKHRARIAAALAEDPDAWESAGRRAPVWGAVRALRALAELYATGRPTPRPARAAAVAEPLRASGSSSLRAHARAWREVTRHPPRGILVTFSGLDGSGKSTQCEALAATLGRLGYEAVVEWTSLVAALARIWTVARVGKAVVAPVLRLGDRLRPAAHPVSGEPAAAQAPPGDPGVPAPGLLHRAPLALWVWTMIVVLNNARWHAQVTRPQLRRGRVVICDRYTLDSKVHLRWAFGEQRSFSAHMLAFRLLSPRPQLAWYLDVAPEAIHRRNQEYTPAQIGRRAALYAEERAGMGVARIDGERPADEIAAALARETWELLRRR